MKTMVPQYNDLDWQSVKLMEEGCRMIHFYWKDLGFVVHFQFVDRHPLLRQ